MPAVLCRRIPGSVSRIRSRLEGRGCRGHKLEGCEDVDGIKVKGGSVHDLKAVFFDDGVCEHFFRNAFELFLCFIATPASEIQNEEFPLADIADGGVAEAGEGVLDGLSLGIEYRTLWHYPYVCFHAVSITSPRTASWFALFVGRPKGVFETHLDNAGQLILLQTHARGVRILFVQRGVKHGRVIG
jgi:hypothetical protein